MSAPDEALTAALATASVDGDDFFPFAALPPALALQIFAALPVDTRLRCAEVCTAWCAAVAERSLWTRLDLSETSGVTHRRGVTPALLRAAAAKAGGALTALDVSGAWQPLYNDGALREVVAANAGMLRELRCCLRGREPVWVEQGSWVRVSALEALLSVAPHLRVCEADVELDDSDAARRALRNEGAFGLLRMPAAKLYLRFSFDATTLSLFADVAAHASLAELQLNGAHFNVPEVLVAFVDAALSLPRLHTVRLLACGLSPTSAPALARLLGSGALTELTIHNDDQALLDAPAALLLGDALRANTELTALTLNGVYMMSDSAAAATLLGALTGHVSLQRLRFVGGMLVAGPLDIQNFFGALFGALVAANAPALTALSLLYCGMGDEGMRPLFEALPCNTHLRELNCSSNDISAAFAADVLLPAVRANASLRKLQLTCYPELDAARQAEALVARRSEAALAAA
jgi:hypothetical protein